MDTQVSLRRSEDVSSRSTDGTYLSARRLASPSGDPPAPAIPGGQRPAQGFSRHLHSPGPSAPRPLQCTYLHSGALVTPP